MDQKTKSWTQEANTTFDNRKKREGKSKAVVVDDDDDDDEEEEEEEEEEELQDNHNIKQVENGSKWTFRPDQEHEHEHNQGISK